jgi:hypothetical protein
VLEGRFKDGDVIVADVQPGEEALVFSHGDAADAAAQQALDDVVAGR